MTSGVNDRRVYPRVSVPARKGCTCSACRGERRRKLGQDTAPEETDQSQAELEAFGADES